MNPVFAILVFVVIIIVCGCVFSRIRNKKKSVPKKRSSSDLQAEIPTGRFTVPGAPTDNSQRPYNK